jgi:hypothetical protein
MNQGDGLFRDETEAAGFLKVAGKGMGVVIANLDDDSWPEVFVANDKTPSYLFHNQTATPEDRGLCVKEVGVESGVAFNGQGELVAGMGIACGDYDQDGLLDLFVTHYQRESDTMYHNLGKLIFSDDTAVVGLGTASLPYLGFGTAFLDYDNNSWLDIAVANGHVLGSAHWSYAMRPQLYRNIGRKFTEVTGRAGEYFAREYVGRALAAADYDMDGRVDFAVSNIDGPSCVVRNTCPSSGNFIQLELVGQRTSRTAVNARITAQVGAGKLMHEFVGGGSYQSSSEHCISIGLAGADAVDSLEIRWPSGQLDRLMHLTANRRWLIVEGREPMERGESLPQIRE